MKNLFRLIAICALVALVGCATPQPPVALDQSFYTQKGKSVGVMLKVPEKPGLALEGNVGLLDYAIISAATSALTDNIERQGLDEFVAVSEDLSHSLESAGFQVVRLQAPAKAVKMAKFKDPDSKDQTYFAARDHRAMAQQYGVDYLLKLTATRTGLARPYYGFVPTDAPRAVFDVHGELIDLSSNQLLWYANMPHAAYADGEWDEKPKFPGLTNSFYVVMNQARQDVIGALAKRNASGSSLALKQGADEATTAQQETPEKL
ncbi:hypothetical protein [Microbulbifer sp. SAOS-129_SWC]|uniref:hypothetical protein n=1 Tax=Microbulbifer sp. SAOS-129_SWC TaxID=3145235 RepID=UPI0032180A95